MSTLRETFLQELADAYDFEKQLIKALPKMAKAAQNEELREGFQEHLEETEEHARRLERIFEIFGEKPKTKKCTGIAGIIAEGEELIQKQAGDTALIGAAQKVEHYEIAAYGTLKTWAENLHENDAADLLQETLQEEKDTDEKLTEAAENVLNDEETNQEKSQDQQARRKAA